MEEIVSPWPNWAKCCSCDEAAKTKDVKLLPCLHLVCSSECTNKITISGTQKVSCPLCDGTHCVSDITKSDFLLELLEKDRLFAEEAQKKICNSCMRGDEAVSWCELCSELLCTPCKQHHGFSVKTHGHELVDVSEMQVTFVTDTLYTPCQLHDEPNKRFCTTCASFLCEICMEQHQEHVTEPLKELVDKTRLTLEKNLPQIRSMIPKYEKMEAALLNKSTHMLQAQREFLITEFQAQLIRLLSALKKREMIQQEEITETIIHKIKELHLKRLKISYLLEQTHHLLAFSRDILNEGSYSAIILNRQKIESQLYRLLDSAKQFSDDGKINTYTEKGFTFPMDKTVVHPADRRTVKTEFNPCGTIVS